VEARAFVWRPQADAAGQEIGPHGGLCAPLLWERQPLGVLVVDNPHPRPGAEEKSLRLLLGAAHYLAAALIQRLDLDMLRANVDAMERLLTRTPPDVRARVTKS
jgi:GAF domain-containing protein